MTNAQQPQGSVSPSQIVARRYDPVRDRAKAEAWFRRLFTEWKDRSGFSDELMSCCADRSVSSSIWNMDDYLKKLYALYILDDGERIIGSNSLQSVPAQPDAVSFHDLSIEPEYQGSAVGFLMYMAIFQDLLETNIHRLVGETWATNVDATKLYKAVGNFWIPGTEIQFENFLLMLYRHPESARFRERHRLDMERWLRSFLLTSFRTRGADLRKHGPDVYEYLGMNVFPNLWKEDGDELMFRVGADSRHVISISARHADVDCYMQPGTSNLLCGATNKSGEATPVAITFLKGATLQDWTDRFATASPSIQLSLAPGERMEKSFTLKPTAATRHALATVITIGESVLPFFSEF